MDQNNIYKDKHASDFTVGSIIKLIATKNSKDCIGKIYIVTESGYVKAVDNKVKAFAVCIKGTGVGKIYCSDAFRGDFELIRGSLK